MLCYFRSTITLLSLAFCLAGCGEVGAGSVRPDVVLIILDTTRADRLGPFADHGQAAATPFLDELAAQSVVFENAWTGSTWTGPSCASIFTGLIPPRHGLVQNLSAQVAFGRDGRKFLDYMADVPLIAMPRSVRTISEHLHDAGYQTVGVATNPNLCDDFGFTRGFDEYDLERFCDADRAVDKLLGMAAELEPTRSRFLFLHLNDPHVPYQRRSEFCPHAADDECNNRCRYRSEISFLDSHLRRLFEVLDLDDDTLVILVNDHGEEFHDHGDIGHRYSVHRELARAALMVKAPGVRPRRSDLPAHHVDILPTVLEVLDLAPPETRDGIALMPVLDDESRRVRMRPLITHREGGRDGRTLWALTLGKWRLLEELPDGVVKLYDIEADPFEKSNVAAARPRVLGGLRQHFAELRAEIEPLTFEHIQVNMTDQLTEDLIKLGYAGDH
jgi:choline-sulfatase